MHARSPSSGKHRPTTLERGPRVYLRSPVLEDAAEFLALRRESREFHAPWEPDVPSGVDPCDEAAFLRFLDIADGSRRQRLLLCRRADDAILGSLSLSQITRGVVQGAMLGYWVGVRHARQGYMRAGLQLLARHAFGHLRLHRLEACIQLDNEPSRRLLQGAGFRLEGVARGYARLGGRWVDHERWARLSTDPRPRRSRLRAAAGEAEQG